MFPSLFFLSFQTPRVSCYETAQPTCDEHYPALKNSVSAKRVDLTSAPSPPIARMIVAGVSVELIPFWNGARYFSKGPTALESSLGE
jgi:hypothetical protein